MFGFTHNASAVVTPGFEINGTQVIGYVNFGVPSGDQDRTDYTNHLIYMYNNGIANDPNFLGQSYDILHGAPAFGASLGTAVFGQNGTGKSVALGAQGTYTYLFAKYDNTKAGSVVWYVGDQSGTIEIAATYNGHDLSSWTLFTSGVNGVPDGGTTVMLLGMAFGALGIARRFIRR